MRVKQMFEGVPYVWEEFKKHFRVVTEQNCKDAVLADGIQPDEWFGDRSDFVGMLVDVRSNEDLGDDPAQYLGEEAVAAWHRLREEQQDELFEELEGFVKVLWWMGDGHRVIVDPHSITEYMEPNGEGGTAVDNETWAIWQKRGYTEQDWW